VKQKRSDRGPERPESSERGPAKGPEIDPLLVEQGAVGNEALQGLLGTDHETGEAGVDLDVVRDVALPMVERAVLALELSAVAGVRPDRFVAIVEASNLSDDRKQVLVDKLQTDRAASGAIDDAVARWFGADAARADVSKALDAVWAGLADGSAAGSAWRVGTRDVDLSSDAKEGATVSRAEALVGDVAHAVVPAGPAREGAQGGIGPAVRGLCRDLILAFAFDEEEEEEEAVGWEMGAQEG